MNTIDDTFVRESGRIGPELLKRILPKSVWYRLQDGTKGTFPKAMGTTITIMTSERVLPSTTPVWSAVTPNTGETNSCVPDAAVIGHAETARTFYLEHTALKTDPICVKDLYTAWEIKQILDKRMQDLEANARYLWEQKFRRDYTSIGGHKVVMNNSLSDSSSSFALSVPTSRLTQGYLDRVHAKMTRSGGLDNSLQMVNGAPQYVAIGSPETFAAIQADISKIGIRDDFRYSKRAEELLGPFGVDRSYRGFFHVNDMFPPRWNFTDGAWVEVDPWIPVDTATNGTAWDENPDYETASYEDTIIHHPDVYSVLYPEPLTSPGGGVSFDPLKAIGNWIWINERDPITNPMRDQGIFYSEFSSSAQPRHPELGWTIRHKRVDFAYQLLDTDE